MPHEEPIAVDRIWRDRRAIIEGVGLAVEPVTAGVIEVGLVFDRDFVVDRPLEARTQPQLFRVAGIVQGIVVDFRHPAIERHVVDQRAAECAEGGARDHAASREGPGKSDRNDRRAPVGGACIALEFDGGEGPKRVRCLIIELPGDARQIPVDVVDESHLVRSKHVHAIIEPLHSGAAAGAEMRTDGAERIHRNIELVANRSGVRLPADVVDRPADGVQTRHQ